MAYKTKKRNIHKYNKTRNNNTRNNNKTRNSKETIVVMFLQMLNTVKLYHWKTHNYAQHKATDELYGKLNENIDTFVEIMLGKTKTGSRVNLTGKKSIPLLDYTNVQDFTAEIERYKIFLISMNNDVNMVNNSDLLNVRDELLGNMNQFTYLLTFT